MSAESDTIEIGFDAATGQWDFHRPSGVALGAARSLTDDIHVEADIADPWVLTSLTVSDSAHGRSFLAACLGSGVNALIEAGDNGLVELDEAGQALRLEIGRWAIADERVEAMGETPTMQAGWLIDAALHASQVALRIPGTIDAGTLYGETLEGIVAALAQDDPLAVTAYTKHRVEAAARKLSDRQAALARDVGRIADWLIETELRPHSGRRRDHAKLDGWPSEGVRVSGSLSADVLSAERFDVGHDLHVHVTPTDRASSDLDLWVRAFAGPDLIALGQVRWARASPVGRAQLLVPNAVDVLVELTDRPQDPVPGDPNIASTLIPLVVRAARSVAADERRDEAEASDWMEVGAGWSRAGDQDRTWLACGRALNLATTVQRGAAPTSRSLPELLENGPRNSTQSEIAHLAADLDPTWADQRGTDPLAVRLESFIGDLFERACEISGRLR